MSARANLIVTYHPTPFAPMKKFVMESVAARTVLTCARHNIAVYSPHTALDCVPGGVNDWLLGSILRAAVGTASAPLPPLQAVQPADDPALAASGAGNGRIARLSSPLPLSAIVMGVKSALALPTVQVALPPHMYGSAQVDAASSTAAAAEVRVSSVAVCAGSGASVLQGAPADVFVTGEMSHHEVLAAVASGTAVILTRHSTSERGFLSAVLIEKLTRALAESPAGALAADGATPEYRVLTSNIDADPLVTV